MEMNFSPKVTGGKSAGLTRKLLSVAFGAAVAGAAILATASDASAFGYRGYRGYAGGQYAYRGNGYGHSYYGNGYRRYGWNNGGALAAGVIGGLALGAIAGSGVYYNQPYPAYGGYYSNAYGNGYADCYVQTQRVWNGYRYIRRNVEVCD